MRSTAFGGGFRIKRMCVIARFVDCFISVVCGVALFPCAAGSWFARWPCLALHAFVVTSIRVALFARRSACLRPDGQSSRLLLRLFWIDNPTEDIEGLEFHRGDAQVIFQVVIAQLFPMRGQEAGKLALVRELI